MTGRRHIALLATSVVLVAAGIGWFDLPLARWFKQFDETALRDIFGFVTLFGEATGYLVISFVLFVWFRLMARRRADSGADLRRARQALFVFVTMAAAAVPVSLLKNLIGRARPRLLFRDEIYGFWPFRFEYDYWSLPSGHTATAVALAMALYFLWPRYGPLYLGAALLVAMSRVIITTHYFADVVAGAYVAFVGAVVVKLFFERRGTDIFDARRAAGQEIQERAPDRN